MICLGVASSDGPTSATESAVDSITVFLASPNSYWLTGEILMASGGYQ
jgi:hypothetical protein